MIKFIVFSLLSTMSYAAEFKPQMQYVDTVAGKMPLGYLGWKSEAARLNAPYKAIEVNDSWIPKSFSWRNSWISPGIRSQLSCGSCVFFAVTRATEMAVALQGFRDVPDLSEQQFLSCDTVGMGCSGSWLESAEYVVNKGLPLEKDFPYAAQNLRCKPNLPVAEKAISYHLLGTANKKPSVKEIQAAILRYGAVFLTVAAGNGWSGNNYVISGCRNTQVNHAITAIGYNEKGFIIANSWGTSWGDKGYALVPYGCDKIGSEAGFIVVE